MLASEIPFEGELTGIMWHRSGYHPPGASYEDVRISAGVPAADELGEHFEENWVPGTRTEVFSAEHLDIETVPDGWFGVDLDAPWHHEMGEALLLEVQHSDSRLGVYTWHWDSGAWRALAAPDDMAERGWLMQDIPHMILLFEEAGLEPASFGRIKVVLARGGPLA